MQRSDLPEVERRMNELADAFGAKPPTARALTVWLDALAECPMADVLNVLTDWPKSHAKMPLPIDVLKPCRERMSERVEKQAKVYHQDDHKPFDPAQLPASSEVAKRYLAEIREILSKPRPSRKAWMRRDDEAEREREAIQEEGATISTTATHHEIDGTSRGSSS